MSKPEVGIPLVGGPLDGLVEKFSHFHVAPQVRHYPLPISNNEVDQDRRIIYLLRQTATGWEYYYGGERDVSK